MQKVQATAMLEEHVEAPVKVILAMIATAPHATAHPKACVLCLDDCLARIFDGQVVLDMHSLYFVASPESIRR